MATNEQGQRKRELTQETVQIKQEHNKNSNLDMTNI